MQILNDPQAPPRFMAHLEEVEELMRLAVGVGRLFREIGDALEEAAEPEDYPYLVLDTTARNQLLGYAEEWRMYYQRWTEEPIGSTVPPRNLLQDLFCVTLMRVEQGLGEAITVAGSPVRSLRLYKPPSGMSFDKYDAESPRHQR